MGWKRSELERKRKMEEKDGRERWKGKMEEKELMLQTHVKAIDGYMFRYSSIIEDFLFVDKFVKQTKCLFFEISRYLNVFHGAEW
jgi:hypothetical protein